MKLSVAIADTHAMSNAFVVFRGFEASIPQAAEMGYDGVELALKTAGEVDRKALQRLLAASGLQVSCISTGQVFAALGLMFTSPDESERDELRRIFRELIDLAADFGGLVNIGRVRGRIGEEPFESARGRFVDMARELCDYAAPRGVRLILEPVNRYEIDFINSVEEGVELLGHVQRDNMGLMPDVFHMNIEDRSIGGELARHIEKVAYVHLADSNRLAPGWGHTDFKAILEQLHGAGYDGWLSIEILPKPDPDSAARQAVDYLKPLIRSIG